MFCPFCRHPDSRVVDSRTSDDGTSIRRRRQCPNCGRRFSTTETASLNVVKRNGVLEPFSREKIVSGVRKACQGRPVTDGDLAVLAQRVEETVRSSGRQPDRGERHRPRDPRARSASSTRSPTCGSRASTRRSTRSRTSRPRSASSASTTTAIRPAAAVAAPAGRRVSGIAERSSASATASCSAPCSRTWTPSARTTSRSRVIRVAAARAVPRRRRRAVLPSRGGRRHHHDGHPLPVAASAWPPGSTRTPRGIAGLGLLGFGHVEVGTITAKPQPGNETPAAVPARSPTARSSTAWASTTTAPPRPPAASSAPAATPAARSSA